MKIYREFSLDPFSFIKLLVKSEIMIQYETLDKFSYSSKIKHNILVTSSRPKPTCYIREVQDNLVVKHVIFPPSFNTVALDNFLLIGLCCRAFRNFPIRHSR